MLTMALVVAGAFSHLRRVRLIAGRIDARRAVATASAGRSRSRWKPARPSTCSTPRSANCPASNRSRARATACRCGPRSRVRVNLRRAAAAALESAVVVRHAAQPDAGDGHAGRRQRQRDPDLRTGERRRGATGSWSTTAPTSRTPKPISRAITPPRRRRCAAASRPPPRRPRPRRNSPSPSCSLLHAQVEPHFLYNTLASAQLLTRSDPARADEMLGHLIQYLRHSLPRTEDELSTLGEELERARRLPRDPQDPHGRAPGGAGRRARNAARHAAAADDAADAGRERDQARPGTAHRRRHRVDPRAPRRRRGRGDRGRRRRRLQRRERRHRHRPEERARTPAPGATAATPRSRWSPISRPASPRHGTARSPAHVAKDSRAMSDVDPHLRRRAG